jgi:glutamate synthase domain-containing protein 3
MEYIDAAGMRPEELNGFIRRRMEEGEREFSVKNAHSMHNMFVGLTGACSITIEDSTGLYTASFLEGPRVIVDGNVGWYAGDDMMDGELIIKKNTGCNVGAYINDGTIVIYGSTGSRVGYGMKGGTILVFGNAGRWAAQMSMGGDLVVLGRMGEQIGESMYRGTVFTRDPEAGAKLGGNVYLDDITTDEAALLAGLFDKYGADATPAEFRAVRPSSTGRHKYVLFKPRLEPEAAKKYALAKECAR